jgi:hypothetical protein
MNKPHKHAALMAEYAKDAAETDTPWERWERWVSDKWVPLTENPLWGLQYEFRRKSETIVANGIECPAPMKVKPEKGMRYWFPMIHRAVYFYTYVWSGDDVDQLIFSRGLCYANREDAIARAKAMLGIKVGHE